MRNTEAAASSILAASVCAALSVCCRVPTACQLVLQLGCLFDAASRIMQGCLWLISAARLCTSGTHFGTSHCRGSPQCCCSGRRRRQAVCNHSCPRAAAAQYGAGLAYNGGAGFCRHQGGSRKGDQAPICSGSSCSRARPPAVCAAMLGEAPGERGCQVASTCRLIDGSPRRKQAPIRVVAYMHP